MISEIKIYSRYTMDLLLQSPQSSQLQWYLISIYSHEEKPYVNKQSISILKDMGMLDCISLNFWDITDEDYTKIKKRYPEAILFNKSHAKKIINFVRTIYSKEDSYPLIIHCSAGISRSGAVGTFACDYAGLDYNKFMKMNPYTYANQYVLRMLRNEVDMSKFPNLHDGRSQEKIIQVWNYKKKE